MTNEKRLIKLDVACDIISEIHTDLRDDEETRHTDLPKHAMDIIKQILKLSKELECLKGE
jgi:hypothetical protein